MNFISVVRFPSGRVTVFKVIARDSREAEGLTERELGGVEADDEEWEILDVIEDSTIKTIEY